MARRVLFTGAALAVVAASGCLRRDVAPIEPTTKIAFETVVQQPAIDKVDLLVMVDNSSSMADKQRILADAVPDLVRGLVQPKCVDKKTRVPTGALADPQRPDGEQCAAGSEPAFPPITDMHIGVLSSSLGGMGSSACKEGRSDDDHGRLLARGANGPVAAAGDLHFLAWYPDAPRNEDKKRHPPPPVPATKSVAALGEAFRDLVVGVGQDGCGLEAQLESVYRFLVQPDPWVSIDVVDGVATYGPKERIDVELLRQRAAFLRPDSLVAVVLLTDEDDSSPDPLSLGGKGWLFGERTPLPRATSACASDPASPACASCSVGRACDPADPRCASIAGDPACKKNGGDYDDEEDPLNVRFHRVKQRFGVDPQFPLWRYVDALTKPQSSEPRRRARARRVRRAPRLRQPALRRQAADAAERGPVQAAAWSAYQGSRVLCSHRWRPQRAASRERRPCRDRLGEDLGPRPCSVRRARDRCAHARVHRTAAGAPDAKRGGRRGPGARS